MYDRWFAAVQGCSAKPSEGERLLDEHKGTLNINADHVHKITALGHACFEGHVDYAAMLLRRGCDIKKASGAYPNQRPLWISCRFGYIAVVRVLLDAGAEINEARGYDGQTALHVAAAFGQVAVARLLLERRADRSLRNTARRTALDVAEVKKQADVLGPGSRPSMASDGLAIASAC